MAVRLKIRTEHCSDGVSVFHIETTEPKLKRVLELRCVNDRKEAEWIIKIIKTVWNARSC